MKRILIGILTLALTLTPAWALAASESEGQGDDFQEAGDIFSPEPWVVPEDGGLSWDEGAVTIALPEDASGGYAWSAQLDAGLDELEGDAAPDEAKAVLTLDRETVGEAEDGALPIHTYVYVPASDGSAELTLYYERLDSGEMGAMLGYTVTVEGGKIADAEYEDLSGSDEWDEGSWDGEDPLAWDDENDDAGTVLYEGETGGVALRVPEGLYEAAGEANAARLESEDKSFWVTIEYMADGDWDATLKEFSDEAALAEAYTDEAKGMSFLSSTVDSDSDPLRVTLVYQLEEDGREVIVDHTVYQAPNGGVLIVDRYSAI